MNDALRLGLPIVISSLSRNLFRTCPPQVRCLDFARHDDNSAVIPSNARERFPCVIPTPLPSGQGWDVALEIELRSMVRCGYRDQLDRYEE